MRLIDADYFKEQIAAVTIKNNIEPKKGLALLELIDAQPTAYNVDEVVEQLERESERWHESGKEYQDKSELGVAAGFRHAIKIVKAGGVNE